MPIPIKRPQATPEASPASAEGPVLAGRILGDGGPNIRLAALRVPLVAKLVGANLVGVGLVLAAWHGSGASLGGMAMLAVGVSVALHITLVLVALQPVRELEAVASRVWRGDYAARVAKSVVADRGVLRVGSMFNILLDGLASDRARMRELAADVIDAGERERAELSHELHDSIAQHLAALQLQLSAAARDARDGALADRLIDARTAAEALLEEVRMLSQTVHPAVLSDLGLEAALRKLAREASGGTGIEIEVTARGLATRLPKQTESVLYRVAQEAVRNATRHASARHVRLNVYRENGLVTLDVHDDGHGFDVPGAERGGRGKGLRSMRERLALVDGALDIRSAKNGGTTVSATIPLDTAPTVIH